MPHLGGGTIKQRKYMARMFTGGYGAPPLVLDFGLSTFDI